MKVLTANAVRMSNAIPAIRVYRSARRHFTVDLIHSSNLCPYSRISLCIEELQYLVHSYLHMKFKASDRAVHASDTSIQ